MPSREPNQWMSNLTKSDCDFHTTSTRPPLPSTVSEFNIPFIDEDLSSVGGSSLDISSVASSQASRSSCRSVTWKDATCSPSRLQEELTGTKHEPRLLSDHEKEVLYFLRPDLSPSESFSVCEASLEDNLFEQEGMDKRDVNFPKKQQRQHFSDQFKHFMRDIYLMYEEDESDDDDDDDDSFFDCGENDQLREFDTTNSKDARNFLNIFSRLIRCECRPPVDLTEDTFPLQNSNTNIQYNVKASRQSLQTGIPNLITLGEKA